MPRATVLDRDRYYPPPRLREIGKTHPDIDWLCGLPPHERRWYREPFRLYELLTRFPDVTDEEWVLLLR